MMSSGSAILLPDRCPIADVAMLRELISQHIAAGGGECRVDCGAVRVIDAAILPTLMSTRIYATAHHRSFIVDAPSEECAHRANTLGLGAALRDSHNG